MKLITKIRNLFRPIGQNTDGYHTFNELYEHRNASFLRLCMTLSNDSWWSRYHSNGVECEDGWVIVGLYTAPGEQITYHVNRRTYNYWDSFARRVKELPFAPLWDHHTSDDVLFRLKTKTI